MSLFLSTAFGFPTVLLTPLLIVVALYWLFVALGAADSEMLDGTDEAGEALGLSAVMGRLGLGRVPVTVALTMLIFVAWFVSMMGSILTSLIDTTSTPLLITLGVVVLLIALVVAWAVTSGLVMGMSRFLPKNRQDSKHELVGRTCVIRIGEDHRQFRAGRDHHGRRRGHLHPVRTTGGETLPLGSTALIFDHDGEDDVFLVTHFDTALDPGQG